MFNSDVYTALAKPIHSVHSEFWNLAVLGHMSLLSLSLSLVLRVIVESTSNSDWSCELINIKKSF